ncbi:MAG: hypothetical protein PUJ36_07455, partial [bacterium]|nr:hypothetical protein [bacterium]
KNKVRSLRIILQMIDAPKIRTYSLTPYSYKCKIIAENIAHHLLKRCPSFCKTLPIVLQNVAHRFFFNCR